jgi:hypothetical protein
MKRPLGLDWHHVLVRGGREGRTLTFIPRAWADHLATLESGGIDRMSDKAYPAEWDHKFDIHRMPLLEDQSQTYAEPGRESKGYDDLTGMRMAVMEGFGEQMEFE